MKPQLLNLIFSMFIVNILFFLLGKIMLYWHWLGQEMYLLGYVRSHHFGENKPPKNVFISRFFRAFYYHYSKFIYIIIYMISIGFNIYVLTQIIFFLITGKFWDELF